MEVFLKKYKKIQFWVMKSSFFEHFYDLTGPKYAEKYEDSESGLKSIHFLAKANKKHDFRGDCGTFLDHLFGKPFWLSLIHI